MRDTVQTVAHEAYRGDNRALVILVVGALVAAAFVLFYTWFKERVKK